MKKLINVISATLLLALILLLNVDVTTMASSGSGTVYVTENMVMCRAEAGVERSGANSYVRVAVDSVYPVSGEDNFQRCKLRIYHPAIGNTVISKEYIMTEGTGYQKIVLYDGYLNWKSFDIYFAGNSAKYPAYVAYRYDGM